MTLTASSARSGARRRGLASTTIRPLQELARAAGRTLLLTTHFSGADEVLPERAKFWNVLKGALGHRAPEAP
jgi:hypothetical protein